MCLSVCVYSKSTVIIVTSLTIVIAPDDNNEHLYEASWQFGVVEGLVKRKVVPVFL